MKSFLKTYRLLFLLLIVCGVVQAEEESEHISLDEDVVKRAFLAPTTDTYHSMTHLFSSSEVGRTTFTISKSGSWKLTRPLDYSPEHEYNGSPMIKITASTVTVDFNGLEMRKVEQDRFGNYVSFGVGLEIGYSPRELAADPTLEQVQSIVIKNGTLSNFEMGIVVHAGVKNVIIENFNVIRSPLGILFLGKDDQNITTCTTKHVRVVSERTDDIIALKWAKVKVEEMDVSSIDINLGAVDPNCIVKGTVGCGAAGFGYGPDCFMKLDHNPVSNVDDAYTYYGIFMQHCTNMFFNDVTINCLGYQEDAHGVVKPGGISGGGVANPVNSEVVINGDIIPNTVTPTVTKGFTICNSSSVFMECIEASNLVSALTVYGIFVDPSSNIIIKHSHFSENDAHHLSTSGTPESITDADAASDTAVVNPWSSDTALSLYGTICTDIIAFPLTGSPLLDASIIPLRDTILDIKTAIDAGVGLAAFLYYVEQLQVNAQAMIDAHALIVAPTVDDDAALVAAEALKISAYNLFIFLRHSYYRSGRTSYGLFFDEVSAIELRDVTANRNSAEHVAMGMFASNSNVFTIHDLICHHNRADNLGNLGAVPVPVASDSHAYGLVMLHVNTVFANGLSTNYNLANGLVWGVFGYDITSWDSEEVSCSNNEAVHSGLSQGWAGGLNFLDATALIFEGCVCNANFSKRGAEGMSIDHGVQCEFVKTDANKNESTEFETIGARYVHSESLTYRDMQASSNTAETQCYGMYFDSCESVEMEDVICDANEVDRTNVAATNCYGLWLINSNSFLLDKVSGSNNQGKILGVGLSAQNMMTMHINDSNFNINSAICHAEGETEFCNDQSDASKFFVRDYISGAVGVYLKNSGDMNFNKVIASKNIAHRAAGIFAFESQSFIFNDCVTSFQFADGNYFIDDPFKLHDGTPGNEISFLEFPIPANQYDTLFGSPKKEDPPLSGMFVPVTELNILQAVCCFMKSAALIPTGSATLDVAIKNLQTGGTQFCPEYQVLKKFAASWLLIQDAMTKYRLFGGAVGLHMHSCTGFKIKGHLANNNTSLRDNAAGIAATGNSREHLLDGDCCINNHGWTESAVGAVTDGRYDLAAVRPFYEALYATSGNTLSDDFDFGSGDQLLPKLANFLVAEFPTKMVDYFKISLDCDGPGGGTTDDLWLTNPVGGIGVGILLADCAEHIEVRNMDCANNNGNSGFGFGLLLDVTSNANIDNNRFYHNGANLLGIGFGVADITIQSTSIYMRNFMFCNRVGDSLNFNHFVPLDPGALFSLRFPVATGYNGDLSTLANVGPYDNVEILFTGCAPMNPCVPDGLAMRTLLDPDKLACWEEAGFYN